MKDTTTFFVVYSNLEEAGGETLENVQNIFNTYDKKYCEDLWLEKNLNWTDDPHILPEYSSEDELPTVSSYSEAVINNILYRTYLDNGVYVWQATEYTYSSSPIWMATCTMYNGVWSDWVVSRIKGEKGTDGTSIHIKGSFEVFEAYDEEGALLEDCFVYRFGNGDNHPWVAPDDPSDCYIVAGNLYVWDGDSWNDVGPFKGDKGDSAYLHIKYANKVAEGEGDPVTVNGEPIYLKFTGPYDDDGKELGEEVGDYIGINTTESIADGLAIDKYDWSYFRGEDGFGYEYIYQLSDTAKNIDLPTDSANKADYRPNG